MRIRAALLVLVVFPIFLCAPLLAEESPLSSRMPDGATLYVEMNGLAGRVEKALASPLAASLREHPAVVKFMTSQQGLQLLFAQGMLQGVTGMDAMGLLKAVASGQVALALYGGPQHPVLLAEVDPVAAEKLLAGAEMMTKQARVTVMPAEDGLPALWQIGPAFVCLDGNVLAVSPDQLLLTSVRSRTAKGLAQGELFRAARPLVERDSMVFLCGDLKALGAKLSGMGLPKDVGQAIFLGAFSHYLPQAGWAAIGLDLREEEGGMALEAQGHVPCPTEPGDGVVAAYGGTLEPLPFALPAHALGVLRIRRDLGALWSNRDALVAASGIPKLIEFETNFGNLTAGMSWVEEFLPSIGKEMILVGARRPYAEGEASPAVRYPEGALLVPFHGSDDVRMRLQVAFHSTIGVVNLQVAQTKGMPLMPSVEEYKGVSIQCARYLPPTGGEMEASTALPARYNFAPAMAIVGDYLALASSDRILKEIIDGMGKSTPVDAHTNAGLWVMADETRAILQENRDSLIAQRMLEKGETRAAAEQVIDLALGLAHFLRGLSLTVNESRASLGMHLRASFAVPRQGE